MASEQIPTDPILRLAVGLAWIKKEWKLATGLALAAVAGLSLMISGQSDGTSGWGARELETMSGLPLAPSGSALPADTGTGPSREDLEEFAKLQRQLSEMPRPDLVDGKGGG
ncbi:MAG TPA: hypothetical protein VNA87_05305 [Actinomycetota bacterium]|nr:hypothetical protein [Actinomycetota bacterium]